MKIVAISASQVPSSTANSIQVMKACQALAQLGHSMRLLVPGAPTPWSDLAAQYGLQDAFEVEWLPSNPRFKRYDFSLAAVQRARALGADVVYTWPPQAAAMALMFRLPILLELHGPPEGKLGPQVFKLLFSLNGRKRFLPITQALANILKEFKGGDFAPGEMVIAPNGVDLERYQNLSEPAAARQELGLLEGLTVVYSGHLYPGRGMNLLVELARRYPAVQFLWVGGRQEDVAYWKRWLAEEQAANVALTGFVQNARLPLYQAAGDVLLMPYERSIAGSGGGNSADYCSPMKMFEYMACGRAIISSALPVIGEVLDASNAVLCPPEDAPAWAEALGLLLEDPLRRQALASKALQDVQQFTWKARQQRALEGFLVNG